MDDQILAEQLAKTGDLMDLCRNEDWVRESARIEAACDGRIEAGLAMKDYAAAKYDDSLNDVRKEMRLTMRVQSILFVELRRWMEEWDIGIAFSDTYTEARERVRAHLKVPTAELKEWVEAVLAEDAQVQKNDEKPVRAQTRAHLSLMMSEDDWKSLAQIAADAAANKAAESVLKASNIEQQSTVAA